MGARLKDLTHAWRRFSKSPGFVAAVVISIGLGIAANSTIFSMVSRFVLRPALVGDPATLLSLPTTEPFWLICAFYTALSRNSTCPTRAASSPSEGSRTAAFSMPPAICY